MTTTTTTPSTTTSTRRRRWGLTGLAGLVLSLVLATAVGAGPSTWFGPPKAFDSQGPLNAVALWTHAFDADDVDLMMEAFTDEPTFVFTLADGTELPAFEGGDAVEALFTGAIADQAPDEVRRHVTTNHLVEQVDPHTAVVRSYLTLLQSTDASLDPDVIATGVYTDTIVRGTDGVWRIDRRELVLDTPTDDDDLTP